jgi:hypothetical protein
MFEAQGAANPDSHPPELPVEGELLAGTRFSELSVLLLAAHRFDLSVGPASMPTARPRSSRLTIERPWMNGGHAAEPVGQFGARPPPSEMELERRALVTLVGIIWVPPFELGPHGGGHEDERDGRASCACPGPLCGRDPVVLVKVLIDPDGHWPVDSESPYAIGAATDAMIRLNRIRSARRG